MDVAMSDPKIEKQVGQMYVAELWRYPVKSLAGERLDSAYLR